MQVREIATGQVLYVDAQEAKTYLASQGWEVVKETAKKVVKEEVAEKPSSKSCSTAAPAKASCILPPSRVFSLM